MKWIHGNIRRLLVILMIPSVGWSFSPLAGSATRHFLLGRSSGATVKSASRARFAFRLFSSNNSGNDDGRKRVVFLGTPDVAASTLRTIFHDSIQENSPYEIVGVVTQPPKKRGRKKTKLEPSPVAVVAEELGIPAMWPDKVSKASFVLFHLVFRERLQTILCISCLIEKGQGQGIFR